MERNQLLSFIYGLFLNHTGDASLFRKIGTLQEFCDLIQIKKIVDTQLNFKVFFFFNWIFKNDQLYHKHLTFGWVSIGKSCCCNLIWSERVTAAVAVMYVRTYMTGTVLGYDLIISGFIYKLLWSSLHSSNQSCKSLYKNASNIWFSKSI